MNISIINEGLNFFGYYIDSDLNVYNLEHELIDKAVLNNMSIVFDDDENNSYLYYFKYDNNKFIHSFECKSLDSTKDYKINMAYDENNILNGINVSTSKYLNGWKNNTLEINDNYICVVLNGNYFKLLEYDKNNNIFNLEVNDKFNNRSYSYNSELDNNYDLEQLIAKPSNLNFIDNVLDNIDNDLIGIKKYIANNIDFYDYLYNIEYLDNEEEIEKNYSRKRKLV